MSDPFSSAPKSSAVLPRAEPFPVSTRFEPAFEKTPDRTVERIPERKPELVVERVVERVPEPAPERVLELVQDRPADRAPERVTDRVAERAPEPMPERVPERVVERVVERLVERAPERVAEKAPAKAAPVPQDFLYDTEHPVLPIPFTVQFGDHKLVGAGLSVAAAYVSISGPLDPGWKGQKQLVRLMFDFQGFTIVLSAEVVVAGSRQPGEMTLQFMEPTGPHLPQLRYIINTYIAGDFVSLGGMLGYTGPMMPKAPKASESTPLKFRIRGAVAGLLSLALIAGCGAVLWSKLTQSYELRPVFIERAGQDMKATTAGQISFLNPAAKRGEVVFSINSNDGDVLSFQLPCDCEVSVIEGVFEGATVLPIDPILSLFDSTFGVRVQTQMSIEGLGKAMNGDQAYLDINDGRSIPVRVVMTSATTAASLRGEPFVPVDLAPIGVTLTQDDIGKAAKLRISSSWFDGSSSNNTEQP